MQFFKPSKAIGLIGHGKNTPSTTTKGTKIMATQGQYIIKILKDTERELNRKQIAKLTGVPVDSVSANLSRLKKALEGKGLIITHALGGCKFKFTAKMRKRSVDAIMEMVSGKLPIPKRRKRTKAETPIITAKNNSDLKADIHAVKELSGAKHLVLIF